MVTIAHISDLHFGRIAHPDVVARLVEEVNTAETDLVVLSGDLTQRARRREYAAAREMLDAIEPPTLVVPGNHDVYPWWRPIRRLTRPLERYREYVTDTLTPRFRLPLSESPSSPPARPEPAATESTQAEPESPVASRSAEPVPETGDRDGETGRQEEGGIEDVSVLGVNSAFGATVKGGRLTGDEIGAIHRTFGPAGESTFKVLVLHHHLTQIRALHPHDIVWGAGDALDAAIETGVDLILCGHLHVSHVHTVDVLPGRDRIVIASAGTATSNRGRHSNRATNYYNRIAVGPHAFTIEERRYVPEDDRFVRDSRTTFDRGT